MGGGMDGLEAENKKFIQTFIKVSFDRPIYYNS